MFTVKILNRRDVYIFLKRSSVMFSCPLYVHFRSKELDRQLKPVAICGKQPFSCVQDCSLQINLSERGSIGVSSVSLSDMKLASIKSQHYSFVPLVLSETSALFFIHCMCNIIYRLIQSNIVGRCHNMCFYTATPFNSCF